MIKNITITPNMTSVVVTWEEDVNPLLHIDMQ